MNILDSRPRTIGTHEVGPVAFGCWRFVNIPVPDAVALVEGVLDAGMNLVDTADVYGFDWGGTGFGQAESLLGEVLAAAPALRDRMVLATKGGIFPPTPYDSSATYLVGAVEDSLRRLQTDHIDLYQIHRPDMLTHPGDLAATLTALVESGKVGAVGVSNYTPDQTRALAVHLEVPLVSTQPQFSALHLDAMRDGTLDTAMELEITPLAWSPLAGGALATGEGIPAALKEVLDVLGEREGCDRSIIALAFVMAHPSKPIAIVGSQKLERLVAYQSALDVQLSRHDCYQIIQASEGVPLP